MYSWNLACNPCCGCTFNEWPLCWQAIWDIWNALRMSLSNIIGDVMVVEMNYCASVLLYEFKFSPVNSVWHNYTILLQFSDIINNCLLLQFCRCLALVLEPVGTIGTMVPGVVAWMVMTMKICHHRQHPLRQSWWLCLLKGTVLWARLCAPWRNKSPRADISARVHSQTNTVISRSS